MAIYSVKRIVSQERIDAMSETAKKNFLEENARIKLYSLDYSKGVSMYKNTIETKNTIYKHDVLPEYAVAENEKLVSVSQDIMLFKRSNLGINFDGKDKLLEWDWEITEETKDIKGYKCIKVISKSFGGNFVAWFTSEIAIKAGLEKSHDLSGLILNLQITGESIQLKI